MVYLYYLKSLKPILLNPYLKNKEIGELDSEEPITVYSANTLTKEDIEYIENQCFLEIDTSVNLWIQEKRYYRRLIASAFAFFIMYFFLSLVIRDPIPLVDEMVGSLAFAIFAWWYFSKQDVKSAIAKKKKLEIKRQVNKATYNELDILNNIEAYIHELQSCDNLDIADALTLVEGELDKIIINEEDSLIADNIYSILKNKMFSIYPSSKALFNKVIKVQESNEKDEALSSKLIEFGKNDKFGLILIALLIALMKNKAK